LSGTGDGVIPNLTRVLTPRVERIGAQLSVSVSSWIKRYLGNIGSMRMMRLSIRRRGVLNSGR